MSRFVRHTLPGAGGVPHRVVTALPGGGFAHLVRDLNDQSCVPCGCDELVGCAVRLMPCYCYNADALRYLLLDDALTDIWPKEDMLGGRVVVLGGVCYRYFGLSNAADIDPALLLDPTGIVVVDSCMSAPCADQEPCPPCSNGGFEMIFIFGSCNTDGQGALVLGCVGRVTASWDVFGRQRSVAAGGQVMIDTSVSMRISYTYEARGGGSQLVGFTLTSSVDIEQRRPSGALVRRVLGRGSYTLGDPRLDGFLSQLALLGGHQALSDNENPPARVWIHSDDLQIGYPGGGLFFAVVPQSVPNPPGDGCVFTVDDGFGVVRDPSAPGAYHEPGVMSVTKSGTQTMPSGSMLLTERVDGDNGGVWEATVARANSTVIEFVDPVSGAVPDASACTDPRYAVACDPQAEPQLITVDARLMPEWTLTVRDTASGHIYTPSTTPSQEPPVDVEHLAQDCPEPPDPDPGDDFYKVYWCGTTIPVDQPLPIPSGSGVPLLQWVGPSSIGYRPGNNLQPGQGHVRFNASIVNIATGEVTCVLNIAGQASAEVFDGTPVQQRTSFAENCAGQPQIKVGGPCLDDVGDPTDPGSLESAAPQDPALAAELERQRMARTGQYPGRCPGCGG